MGRGSASRPVGPRGPGGPGAPSDVTETAEAGTAAPRSVPAPDAGGDDDLAGVDGSSYEIGEEVSRGGLGRILRAHDRRLGRTVAIKQLLGHSTRLDARFRREARITARLQHPGIVPVYEAGRWPSGEPFYAMKLVGGRSLKVVLEAAGGLDERLALLPHVLAIAEAMAYAHSQRVIHRDLKPANVMVGDFGETVVVDWGLARQLGSPADDGDDGDAGDDRGPAPDERGLTAAGAVLGTPPYLAPEQARGTEVDERADVYALGAILYHVLCGRPPYAGANTGELLDQVRDGPPPPVPQVEPGAPADLAAIVALAMAREPEDRYPTARELADDLRRFLTGQLVGVHHYSAAVLARRWLRKHRAPVTVGVLAAVALAAVGVVSLRRVVGERDRAERARTAADQARADAERERARTEESRRTAEARKDELLLAQAQSALDKDPTAAMAWLAVYAAGEHPDWLAVEALAADARSRGVATHVRAGMGFAQLSPDGATVAAYRHPDLVLWNIDTNVERVLAGTGARLRDIHFSYDGAALVVTTDDSRVTVWNVATGEARVVLGGARFRAARFSHDDRTIAAGDEAGVIRLLDVASGQVRALPALPAAIRLITFSPDGRYLVSGDDDEIATVWDVAGGEPLYRQPVVQGAIVDFSDDSRLLAFAENVGGHGRTGVLDLATGRVRRYTDHQGDVGWIDLSPDATELVTGGTDHAVRLLDLATGKSRLLGEHAEEVFWAFFSDDATRIVSGAVDGSVKLWDPTSGDAIDLRGHVDAAVPLLTHEGRRLVTRDMHGELRVWTVSPPRSRVLRGHAAGAQGFDLGVTPDGLLASVASDGVVNRWDVATGAARAGSRGALTGTIAVSPDGQHAATPGLDGKVWMWDLASGGSRALAAGRHQVSRAAFSPDGTSLAAVGADGRVRIFDLASGAVRELVATHAAGSLSLVAFSPDGRWLSVPGEDPTVHLWDLAAGTERALTGHGRAVENQAFSPDSRYLATGAGDGSLRLWDTATGQSRELAGHTSRVDSVAFSPDGATLASGSEDGTVRLWDVTGGTSRVLANGGSVQVLAFSPDGRRLVTGADDGRLRVWEPASGRLLEVLRGHRDRVLALAFGPDGGWLASAGADMDIRVWPLSPAPPPPPPRSRAWLDAITTVELGPDSRPITK